MKQIAGAVAVAGGDAGLDLPVTLQLVKQPVAAAGQPDDEDQGDEVAATSAFLGRRRFAILAMRRRRHFGGPSRHASQLATIARGITRVSGALRRKDSAGAARAANGRRAARRSRDGERRRQVLSSLSKDFLGRLRDFKELAKDSRHSAIFSRRSPRRPSAHGSQQKTISGIRDFGKKLSGVMAARLFHGQRRPWRRGPLDGKGKTKGGPVRALAA
jgi:hypothetical protein